MCFCCCCCCNCCNSFSSRCIEFSIFILCICSFVFSILNMTFIKWTHLQSITFILIMIQVLFSSIITLSSVFIIIYRFKGVINQKRNSMGICLARIGLIISFATFFITIVSESMVQSDLNTTDHPCKNYNKDKNVVYFQNGRLLSTDSDNDYCKDKSNNYNAKICENIEYTISYLSSTILECCSFLLIFFWFNDLRRIKEKVDGTLSIYGGEGGFYLSKNKYIKKNVNFRDKNENQINENDSNFNSVNRYFNQNNSERPQVILVKNNNTNRNKLRLSQPLNMNFVRKKKQNFIRNLRQEMKEGIESIEEEDSSESKENENNNRNNNDNKNKIKKEENFKVSIYNNKKRENDLYKRTSIKKHNTNLSSNKNKIKEIHNIEKDITNIEEIKENNNDMCDLDLYSDK